METGGKSEYTIILTKLTDISAQDLIAEDPSTQGLCLSQLLLEAITPQYQWPLAITNTILYTLLLEILLTMYTVPIVMGSSL